MFNQTLWQKCVDFHGHECSGLTIGFRQALAALDFLNVQRASDEELFAIVETDACNVDAVSVLTGCTLGKGNLILKNTGKMALTLANRKTHQAIRVVMRSEALKKAPEGSIDDRIQRMNYLQNAPINDICNLKEAHFPNLPQAKLFNTLTCGKCGEPFAESKARLENGDVVCLDCCEEYVRGW